MLAAQRDAGRVNLRETRIAKQRAAAMGPPYGSTVGSLGIRREVEDIGISSGRQHNHVGGVAIDLTGHQVPRHDAARSAIDNDDVEQFTPDMHRHSSGCDLLFEGLISAQQELLSRLAARVEGSFDLHATERPIV